MTPNEDVENHSEHVREYVREAVTMALYLSLSLLAVLFALPTKTAAQGDPVTLVLMTAVGLLVAHLLAFAISSRLVSQGQLDDTYRRAATAQLAAGAFVVILVTAPMILFDTPTSLRVAEGLLLVLIAGVGFEAARQANASVFRALMYVAVVIVAAGAVLVVKALAGH